MRMKRSDVAVEDQWNVEALYSHVKDWNKDFTLWSGRGEGSHWASLNRFQGRLKEGVSIVKEVLELSFELERQLTKLYVYAHLRQDEDVGHTEHKEMFLKIATVEHEFKQEISWISPELLQMSEKQLQ